MKKRNIPAGAKKIVCEGVDAVVYTYKYAYTKRTVAMGFVGKRVKPSWNKIYDGQKELQSIVDSFFEEQKEELKKRNAEKQLRNTKTMLQVGDVVVNFWGFNAEFITFYQVVKVNTRSVRVCQIDMNVGHEKQAMVGWATPIKNVFVGDVYTVKTYGINSVMINKKTRASLWNGKEVKVVWYTN
jgi:hypothetical protein